MVDGKLIEKPRFQDEVIYKDGDTNDIMTVILKAIEDPIEKQTAEFAKQFEKNKREMSRLWTWTKNSFIYKEDPFGVQWIREPSRAWQERRKGIDCKSFTVFLCSVFKNLNVDFKVRFVSYSMFSKTPTHVYPLVKVENEWIIMDCVWNKFNSEKAYSHKIDKEFKMPKISRLSGIGALENEYLRAVADMMRNIPDSVLTTEGGDVTQMTEGEFARMVAAKTYEKTAPQAAQAIRAGSVNGIYGIGANQTAIENFIERTRTMNAPAFEMPEIGNILKKAGAALKTAGKKVVTAVKTAGNKVVQVVKDAGAWLKEQWQKLLNWILKTALPGAAPFFLFSFVKKATPKIAAKAAKQNQILDWICRVGNFERSKLDAVLRQGIVKKYGKQPEEVLNETAKKSIAGIGVVAAAASAIMKLAPMVLDIIKKIAALFKKSDAPTVSAEAASTLEDLQEPEANVVIQPPTPSDEPPAPPQVVKPLPSDSETKLKVIPKPTPQEEPETPELVEETNSYQPQPNHANANNDTPKDNTPKENNNMMMILAVVGIGAALYLSNK